MSNPRYHNGHRRREVQACFSAHAEPTATSAAGQSTTVCGRRDPHWSFVIDETVAIANGGRVCKANSGPAHRWCNAVKGTHTLALGARPK